MTVLASFRNVFSEIRKNSAQVNFVERSHLDGLKVFAPTLVEGGLMNSVEFDTLSYVAESMFDENDRVDGYVYLRTDPELCLKRVKSRSRSEESSVNLCYLQSLNDKYEEWMSSEDRGSVLVIDNNVDLFSEQYQSYAKQVEQFVVNLCNEI
jgi:deoxyadenosine/deoxycytidine kinase